MNAYAGLFKTSEAADDALADLRLQGFTRIRLEPCPARGETVPAEAPMEGEVPAPAGAQPAADLADDGGIPLGGWSADTSGWSLLNLFQINEIQQKEAAELGATFVVVETEPEHAAVVRMILERNGVEQVRPVSAG